MVVGNIVVSWDYYNTLAVSFEEAIRDAHQEFSCLHILPREFVGEVGRTGLCAMNEIATDDAKRRLRDRRVIARVTLLHISDEGFEERRVAKFISQIPMQIRDMKDREFHVARLPQ